MNRKLDSTAQMGGQLVDLGTTWSDYDGDEIYGDFTVTGTTPTVTNTDQYEPGSWRNVGGVADYLHNDHLGTLRMTTGTTGSSGDSRVFTAFGEPITQSGDRFGYVGAWGYQSTPIPESLTSDPFPFLHVGARYYDPSTGRFLQRDPVGIRGGRNVYLYVNAQPTNLVDPPGLWSWPGFAGGVGVGVGTGAKFPGLTKIPGAIAGALVCGIAGGLEKKDPGRLWDKVKETVDDYIDRNTPKPPQPPRPPANKPGDSFSRPPGAAG